MFHRKCSKAGRLFVSATSLTIAFYVKEFEPNLKSYLTSKTTDVFASNDKISFFPANKRIIAELNKLCLV